ncbi:MAG: OmpH family outer membrane protein [Pseudomonadota bacterium]
MKKTGLIFILSLILFSPNLALGASATGIGYVDLQRALNMSDAGKEAKRLFSQKVRKAQETVEAKQEELKRLKDSIEKQSLILKGDAKRERERAYQKELRDYQRFIKDSQEELKREEAEMSQDIISELGKVVERIGKEGNYVLILEKTRSAVLYASDTVDLTGTVIKAYNEQRKQN